MKVPAKRVYISLAAAVLVAAGLYYINRLENPLPPGMQADKILVNKSNHTLSLFRSGQILKVYRVALSAQPVGHKQREGDNKVPEGLYTIDARNPNSRYYLSLHVSYPSPSDEQQAVKLGVSPGGEIMIHGIRNGLGWLGKLHRVRDWTKGCIAVTDGEIREIWQAVPDGTPIEIVP